MIQADKPADPAEWTGLLSRVGSELRTLAVAVADLQQFLTPLAVDVVGRDPEALTRLQDLDRLEQSLHGLSNLMSHLDASIVLTDAGALASGLKTIQLAALARRLAPEAGPAADAPVSSVLELF